MNYDKVMELLEEPGITIYLARQKGVLVGSLIAGPAHEIKETSGIEPSEPEKQNSEDENG